MLTEFVGMIMMYEPKFHVPSSNILLVITKKSKTKYAYMPV